MAIPVLADPQFGLTRILRPFAGFEADYQGKPANTPLMLTEVLRQTGGEPIDEIARKKQPGYAPNLLRGLKVPLGARVVFHFPNLIAVGLEFERYRWLVTWRLRNVHDFRVGRIPYHYPKQGAGVPDSTFTPPASRVVIPAANQTLLYPQAVPSGAGSALTGVQTSGRTEEYTFAQVSPPLPLIPGGGTGVYQQGLSDPSSSSLTAGDPQYQILELQATGDELMIGITRSDTIKTNWDFSLTDRLLALFLGDDSGASTPRPDIGVYVMMGSSP